MSGIFHPKDPRQAFRRFSSRLFLAVATPPKPGNWWRWLIVAAVVVIIGIPLLYWAYQASLAFLTSRAADDRLAEFCTDLKKARYDAAYDLLSDNLHQHYTTQQFHDAFTELTQPQHQGALQECLEPVPGRHDVDLRRGTADIQLEIDWTTVANPTKGDIHFGQEGGTWKVTSIDASLLTVGLGALTVALAYCKELHGLDFSNAYTMLDSNARDKLLGPQLSSQMDSDPLREFNLLQIYHYILDGEATCNVSKISSPARPNTNDYSSVIIAVSRTNVLPFYDTVEIATPSNGIPQINAIELSDQNGVAQQGDAEGSDMTPLLIGDKLCQKITKGQGDVNSFLSDSTFAVPALDVNQVVQQLYPGNRTYAGCYPDLGTYQPPLGSAPSGSITLFTLTMKVSDKVSAMSAPCRASLTLEKSPQNTWLVTSVVPNCPAA